MKTLILTVQSNGNGGWRLGLSKPDSENYFTHLESVRFLLSNGLEINCNAACGISKKKSFDFNNKLLSKWIIENKFDKYPKESPTKILFKLTKKGAGKTLTYVSKKNNSKIKGIENS
ncbi:MAG: hypothetical protein WCP61_08605 [Chitinophagia bacterium]